MLNFELLVCRKKPKKVIFAHNIMKFVGMGIANIMQNDCKWWIVIIRRTHSVPFGERFTPRRSICYFDFEERMGTYCATLFLVTWCVHWNHNYENFTIIQTNHNTSLFKLQDHGAVFWQLCKTYLRSMFHYQCIQSDMNN